MLCPPAVEIDWKFYIYSDVPHISTHTHGNGTVVDKHPNSFPARTRKQASCPASTAVSRAELETSAHEHGDLTLLVYLLNATLELGEQEIPIFHVNNLDYL